MLQDKGIRARTTRKHERGKGREEILETQARSKEQWGTQLQEECKKWKFHGEMLRGLGLSWASIQHYGSNIREI